jgi:hypothetical protein
MTVPDRIASAVRRRRPGRRARRSGPPQVALRRYLAGLAAGSRWSDVDRNGVVDVRDAARFIEFVRTGGR